MRYFTEMFNNKYGFNDGQSVPPEAHAARRLYLAAVNAIAERLGSRTRLVPYNRPGLHNPCLILCVTAEALPHLPHAARRGDPHALAPHLEAAVTDPDRLMRDAIKIADRLPLDDYLRPSGGLDDAFYTTLPALIDTALTTSPGTIES